VVNFHPSGSGFAYAIWIRFQDSRINADPDHWGNIRASGGWLVSELARENVDPGAGGGGGGQEGGP
jgi:hypothetical protein